MTTSEEEVAKNEEKDVERQEKDKKLFINLDDDEEEYHPTNLGIFCVNCERKNCERQDPPKMMSPPSTPLKQIKKSSLRIGPVNSVPNSNGSPKIKIDYSFIFSSSPGSCPSTSPFSATPLSDASVLEDESDAHGDEDDYTLLAHQIRASDVQFISCNELKQLLHENCTNILLLDARDKKLFEHNHIITSINFSPTMIEMAEQQMDKKLDNLFNDYYDKIFFRQREFVKVVLYDNDEHLYATSPVDGIHNEDDVDDDDDENTDHDDDDDENDEEYDDDDDDDNFTDDKEQNSNEKYEKSNVSLLDCKYVKISLASTSLKLFALLKREGASRNIFILQGGFPKFEQCYPIFCSAHAANVNSKLSPNLDVTERKSSTAHSLSLQERAKLSHRRLFQSLKINIDCELPSRVLSHVYVGSAQNSVHKQQLKQLKVAYVLNTAKECKNHYPLEFIYMNCPLVDDGEIENVSQHFESTYQYLEMARKKKSRVLVHCFMGMSRSVAIVLAYIMRYKNWSLKKAYKSLREKRPIIDVNPGFMYQLIEYEKQLFGISSIPILPFRKT